MKNSEFEKKNGDRWREYEQLLLSAEKRGLGLDVSRLPAMFREVCTDLALARHRMYRQPLNEHLNSLVIRGHKLMNRRLGGTWEAILRFLAVGFPQAVRREWRLLIVATLTFILPLIAVALSGVYWPDYSWIQAILGLETMRSMDVMYGSYEDMSSGLRSEYGSNFAMFSFYILNNVRIDFQIFAGGIFACVGSLFFLFYNGIFFGAIVSYIHMACSTKAFYTFVAGHSSFELIGMVVAGMAGLRIGLGLLKPGRMTRGKSLVEAGKKSLPLIFGAALMTFFAAIIEGFWSAEPMPPVVKYTVGIGLWFVCFAWLGLAGLGVQQKKEGEVNAA